MNSTTLWKINFNAENCTPIPITLGDTDKTLDDISLNLPDGVYTTFRTYAHSRVLSLHQHFLRLEDSSQQINKPINLDFVALRNTLRELINKISETELRVRISVDLEKDVGTVYIFTEPLSLPRAELYRIGGRASTVLTQRKNPKAKLTRHLEVAVEIRKKQSNHVNEFLLTSNTGQVLEGLSSNFFVVKKAELWTAEENVLQGTVRGFILDLASKLNINVIRQSINVTELSEIEEAFITSTSRSILPIVEIDHLTIGNGLPGPKTRLLMQEYQKWLQNALEEI